MKDYSKGKIYCIRSYQTDMVYVGSTIQSLSRRLVEHRNGYKRYLNGKYNYVSSFEILKYEDCYIELIKLYPCSCKSELDREEGKYIRELNCVNKRTEGITREENKEKKKITNKKYNQKNKEMRNEKFNCQCGGRYTHQGKSTHFKSKLHQKYLNEKI